MSLVWAKIAEHKTGRPVHVRPNLVAALRSAAPVEGTEIHFASGGMILVDGELDDIQAILDQAVMEGA